MNDSGARTLVQNRSVEFVPEVYGSQPQHAPGQDAFILQMVTAADAIPQWGKEVARRDRMLREFWPTEPILASAVFSVAAANAALSWTVDGPRETVAAAQEMLLGANFGRGWLHFVAQFCIDLLTQDNGAFIELIRGEDRPDSPVLGIQCLDAARCVRTGNPETPVIYWDALNRPHRMAWYQIVPVVEFPSPVDSMNGMQYSACTRVLRAAQILFSIGVYKDEKISGRNPRAINIVGGVRTDTINSAIEQSRQYNDNIGRTRYMNPIILASLDPREPVSNVTIELAGLPDAFDAETELKWYITQLAMGFGRDYQDFAPLPGGNLGTSTQAEVLARKSRGKGPGLFMKNMAHIINWSGILPQNVLFRFNEPDAEADRANEEVRRMRFRYVNDTTKSGVFTPEVARAYLERHGDITPEELAMLGAVDVTPDVQIGELPSLASGSGSLDQRVVGGPYLPLVQAYQRKLEALGAGWIETVAKAIEGRAYPDAAAEIERALAGVERQMLELGGRELRNAYLAGLGEAQIQPGDEGAIALSLEENAKYVRSSLIPWVRDQALAALAAIPAPAAKSVRVKTVVRDAQGRFESIIERDMPETEVGP